MDEWHEGLSALVEMVDGCYGVARRWRRVLRLVFLMDGELYSYFFLLHDLGWGAVLFVLLSPPGFFTSLRGVTGVWHDGLLALVVTVLTAATVWHDCFPTLVSLTRFLM
jgi:hypothetical protein